MTPFPFIGLLGLLLFAVAFFLLVSGSMSARDHQSTEKRVFAALARWFGAAMLALAAFRGGALAYAVAIHRVRPGSIEPSASPGTWLSAIAVSLLGAFLFALSNRGPDPWSLRGAAGWFAAAAAVLPLAVLFFFLLAVWLPFRA